MRSSFGTPLLPSSESGTMTSLYFEIKISVVLLSTWPPANENICNLFSKKKSVVISTAGPSRTTRHLRLLGHFGFPCTTLAMNHPEVSRIRAARFSVEE